MKRKKTIFILVVFNFLVAAGDLKSHARELTLIWDPNPSEQNVIGYTVWYGHEPRPDNITHPDHQGEWQYPFRITVTDGTAYKLPELPPGDVYFSVTAFNRNEISRFSEELHHVVQRN